MSTKILPPHPGEVLLEEFMKPMDLTANRLAMELHVTPARIGEIIHGRRSITAETALRLAQFFGTSAQRHCSGKTQEQNRARSPSKGIGRERALSVAHTEEG